MYCFAEPSCGCTLRDVRAILAGYGVRLLEVSGRELHSMVSEYSLTGGIQALPMLLEALLNGKVVANLLLAKARGVT